ncbi:MAG: hypothetical protein M2R46_03814 [Verrucomicrobia subdivision 3 bacterium]|nr:hypothetical protein [Limisphaerales bacterium]
MQSLLGAGMWGGENIDLFEGLWGFPLMLRLMG